MSDWKSYINANGDFELPNFLYKSINELMKQALDMGTLLSTDSYKLRAYKEQTKKLFKNKWFDIAESLEFFGVIDKCLCTSNGKDFYCEVCKGARYMPTSVLTPDEMREIGVFVSAGQSIDLIDKLNKSISEVINNLD
jgi:hypothetical protein